MVVAQMKAEVRGVGKAPGNPTPTPTLGRGTQHVGERRG